MNDTVPMWRSATDGGFSSGRGRCAAGRFCARALAMGMLVVSVAAVPGAARADAARNAEPMLRLPPLTKVTEEDESGGTWRQTGTLPGGMLAARRDFTQCFARQGWSIAQVIPLPAEEGEAELRMFSRGGRRLLLMLRQAKPGQCEFSWGYTD